VYSTQTVYVFQQDGVQLQLTVSAYGDHGMVNRTSLVPRPLHLQFLIACSMQKWREKA